MQAAVSLGWVIFKPFWLFWVAEICHLVLQLWVIGSLVYWQSVETNDIPFEEIYD